MYKHILIATDGSDLAQKGLEQGLELAAKLGSKVTILTVTEPFPMMATASSAGWIASPKDVEIYNENQAGQAQSILKAAGETAAKHGVTAELKHIDDRWPAEAITDFSGKSDVDLIVMTSHGRRGLGRLLLGSQTSEVLTHTKTAILVVR
ncbi:universal stress protein [Pseudochrobactrum kiredjianiae]|uniref:Universal stress protein n=1 Tax=Pseudochrobactrum kiredjianiae TaxID=386305 RepID=A0ABW3V2K8_9HYPH|nr:universal stress protein [Pseudochrobactrum kiredjianiae]MDM7851761.1 universal stress protein [Pseudochrobactrum kiredjianiae]